MQTTYRRNRFYAWLCVLVVITSPVSISYAASSWHWLPYRGQVGIRLVDRTYNLKLSSSTVGIYLDDNRHRIQGRDYISLLQVSYSNPETPEGRCGAGREVWLLVFEEKESKLEERLKVLVSSCLHSILLASQNTGEEDQDNDFSSVRWNADGISVDWFQNVDSAGRLLARTNYLVRDAIFLTNDTARN